MTFEDGPIVRMMTDVVLARIRISQERFGTKPDFVVFPDYIKKELAREVGGPEGLPKKLELLGVKIEWSEER